MSAPVDHHALDPGLGAALADSQIQGVAVAVQARFRGGVCSGGCQSAQCAIPDESFLDGDDSRAWMRDRQMSPVAGQDTLSATVLWGGWTAGARVGDWVGKVLHGYYTGAWSRVANRAHWSMRTRRLSKRSDRA